MSGFFFANLWGLLALGSLAAVVGAYLFYRRYPPRRVTGLFLWGDPKRQMAGGRTLEPPRFGRSFWLDFLAALLLALAIAGPSWLLGSGNLPVVILDDSFSMQARGNHESALALTKAILAQADHPGAVILAGDQPQLLFHPDTSPAEAQRRLADYRPARRSCDLAAALRSAIQLYPQPLEVHVITDHDMALPVREGDSLILHRLAGQGGNLAFDSLWRARTGGEDLVHARIVNFSAQSVKAEFTLTPVADQENAASSLATPRTSATSSAGFRKIIELAPGASADCEAAVQGSAGILLAHLIPMGCEDVITADSMAWLLPPPPQTVSYGVNGLDAESARYVRLALDAAGAVASTSAATQPALLVTSDSAARGRILTLELPAPVTPTTFSPPFVVDLTDPLCRDVHLGTGYWTVPLDQPKIPREEWLIFAGLHPLFWRAARDRYVLNLVPQKSSIVMTPAWPALFANLAAQTRQRLPGLRKTVYAPGQTLDYRPAASEPSSGKPDVEALALHRGDALQVLEGDRVLASASLQSYLRLPFVAGRYDLRQDGEYKGTLAVLPLYGEESDTRKLAAVRRDLSAEGKDGEAGRAVRAFFWLPLLLGLALLLLNWRLGEER